MFYSHQSYSSSLPSKLSENTQQNCQNIYLQVLGSGGPEINDGLASSSYLIWINNKARLLIDAGGGSSLRFEESAADFNDLQAILLSHLHVDHSAALPVYLKAGYFTGREKSLPIFGPSAGKNFPSTTQFVAALVSDEQLSVYPYLADTLIAYPYSSFLIKPQNIKSTNNVWHKKLTTKNNVISLSAISVTHGEIPAIAWRVDINNCAITFSGDMNGTSNNLTKLAKNSDILVAHNAVPEQAFPIAKTLHMIPTRIGEIAQQAKVKKLVLSHFMLRTINKKQETIRFIKKYYKGEVVTAKDLYQFH
jgi:ribonuclease BN (tRNA processing enzyme)